MLETWLAIGCAVGVVYTQAFLYFRRRSSREHCHHEEHVRWLVLAQRQEGRPVWVPAGWHYEEFSDGSYRVTAPWEKRRRPPPGLNEVEPAALAGNGNEVST